MKNVDSLLVEGFFVLNCSLNKRAAISVEGSSSSTVGIRRLEIERFKGAAISLLRVSKGITIENLRLQSMELTNQGAVILIASFSGLEMKGVAIEALKLAGYSMCKVSDGDGQVLLVDWVVKDVKAVTTTTNNNNNNNSNSNNNSNNNAANSNSNNLIVF